ncbi:helix-turn-helix domain-containing protein [Streptomyces luteocolor]|uniref:helix-turn-helix domain-containing protein n=1 Tax=Streptomyces luteocolor TaxID=285500 RepID=UPI0008532EFD|nr:helix-turn-helix domain-containing protein [Streptomyces luteocolor]
MLRVRDVATHFRVHPATVYRWVKQGLLPAYRHGKPYKPGDGPPGGAIRIPESVLDETALPTTDDEVA